MSDGLVKFVCIGGPWATGFLWLANEGKTAHLCIGDAIGRYVKRNENRYSFDGGAHRTLGVHWEPTPPYLTLQIEGLL